MSFRSSLIQDGHGEEVDRSLEDLEGLDGNPTSQADPRGRESCHLGIQADPLTEQGMDVPRRPQWEHLSQTLRPLGLLQ
ncbi:unnamed protein product [Boreogadus saida]